MTDDEIKVLDNAEYTFFSDSYGIDFDSEKAVELQKLFDYQNLRYDHDEDNHDIGETEDFHTKELIDMIANINCEADFVSEILNCVGHIHLPKSGKFIIKDQEIEKIYKKIDEVKESEYKLYVIRNYIRTEIIRYYAFRRKNLSDQERIIQEVLQNSIDEYDKEIPNNCWYPIRIRVQRILNKFRNDIAHNASGAKTVFLNRNIEQILRKIDEENYKEEKENKKGEKKRYINTYKYHKGIREALEEFRINMPGTLGHLLWLIYYIGEILYFQVTENKEEDIRRRYTLKSTKNSQSDYLREDTFTVDEGTLNRMFRDFVRLTEEWRGTLGFVDNIRWDFSGTPRRADIKNELKRITRILKQDKIVGKIFYPDSNNGSGNNRGNGSGHGDEKGTCFSILTNFKKSYIAFSGYGKVKIGNNKIMVWKYCKNILSIRCKNNNFRFINPSEYGYSEYRWISAGTNKVMTYQTADSKRGAYKQKYSKDIPARMYSCSERRLVHKHKPGYVIISKLAPCYICERVLNSHKIIYYPSGMTMGLQNGVFDGIADRLDQIP